MQKRKLHIEEFVSSVHELVMLVKDTHSLLYFPDSWGSLILEVFQKIVTGYNIKYNTHYNFNYLTSKITSLSKVPLSVQIVSLLSDDERRMILTDSQKKQIIEEIGNIAQNREISFKVLSILDETLENFIDSICSLWLYVPSEDLSALKKLGIVGTDTESIHGIDYKSKKSLNEIKNTLVPHIITNLDSIIHPTRYILNIALEWTKVAQLLKQNKTIYVIDEAISRGRTINSLDIILKSFFADIQWKIWVLYSSVQLNSKDKVDYIYSNRFIPFFSNKPNLAGKIVLENKSYKIISINELQKNYQVSIPREFNIYKGKILRYSKRLKESSDIPLRTIKKLILYICASNWDIEKVRECLKLKLRDLNNSIFIEESDFYIAMPNPFSRTDLRQNFNKSIELILHIISTWTEYHPELQELIRQYTQFGIFYKKTIIDRWLQDKMNLDNKLDLAINTIFWYERHL